MKKLGYIFLFCLLLACSDEKNQSNSINWVKIDGDEFQFGSKKGKENEKPEVPVRIKDFKISSSEISVGQFHEFIVQTSYQTQAEKNGYSSIFKNGEWKEEKYLSYLNPNGENQEFELIKDWPAVHISFDDAQAYCKWKKGRLPSEIEMEFLMERSQQKKMNIWSGDFPDMDDGADGWKFLAPVQSVEKDKMGLFHLKGNVWEWCEDIYHFEMHDKLAFKKKRSQKAYIEQGYDIGNNENAQEYRVIKGGSYLCHKSYCAGYRPEARQKAKFNETFAHIGFRIVKDIK